MKDHSKHVAVALDPVLGRVGACPERPKFVKREVKLVFQQLSTCRYHDIMVSGEPDTRFRQRGTHVKGRWNLDIHLTALLRAVMVRSHGLTTTLRPFFCV